MFTLAILARKGGAGKTALAVNLAAGLGKKTLLVDLDEQGTATGQLGIESQQSIAEALQGRAARPVKTEWGFDILPPGRGLYQLAVGMSLEPVKYAGLLKGALAKFDYERVIIDTAPAINALFVNALVAADAILISVNTAGLPSYQGFVQTTQAIEAARASYSGRISAPIAGICPNIYHGRTRTHRAILKRLRADWGELVLPAVPASVKVAEAATLKQPLRVFAPNSKPAKAYEEICEHVNKIARRQVNSDE